MIDYPRLTVEECVDSEAECLYRYVYGANDIFFPHTHTFYEIFITVSGTVTHFINGVKQKLPEGSLVFIRPDDVHAYIYDSPESNKTAYINLAFTCETTEMLFCYLSASFPSHTLLSSEMPPTITLNSIEKKRLLSQIEELNIINWQDKKSLKIRMRALLSDIFVRYFSSTINTTYENKPLWLLQLLTDMEEPQNFIGGTERMIALSQKSREHLARSLKQYFNVTPSEYINELRLNYASNLLIHTNTPVLKICYDSGFQSPSYFYKVFGKKYEMSPNEFRKQYKQ
ncbi:MAG: helix-turn-helix domain-containing protein [Clostridia bacterium]|nr:helix-turn-helix domain-containing protein [Clostridia bacterium]